MKRLATIIFAIACLATVTANAQMNRQAVESGISKANNLIAAHNWSEAFATLRSLDAAIGEGGPDLHYLVAKQRYSMYSRINKNKEAWAQLVAMEDFSRRSGDSKLIEDLLLNKAAYYNRTGYPQQSRSCYKDILNMRAKNAKDDDAMEKCFKNTIADAKSMKNNIMANVVNEIYTAWQDSIAGVRSANALKNLQAKYDEAQEEISSQDTKIAAQWATIIILLIIALGLGGGLAFFVLTMLRNVSTIKKLRQSLKIANTSNDQKSVFIKNISKQISPSLNEIAAGNTKQHIPALQTMLEHVEDYMALETCREEKYEMEDANVGDICAEVAGASTGKIPVTAESQKLSFKLNKEAVVTLLNAVVKEGLIADGTEKITVSFKKRNPHTGNFVVNITGMKVAEEEREQVFVAFSKVHDLTVSDGLNLPTCALMAYKMGGKLFIDPEFARGTRFVLEVHC